MLEVKRIQKVTLANILGAVYGTIGFFTSIVLAILVGSNIISQSSFSGSGIAVILFHLGAGALFGILTFIVTGTFGWVIGYILASIYNFTARKVGGVKIEIDENLD